MNDQGLDCRKLARRPRRARDRRDGRDRTRGRGAIRTGRRRRRRRPAGAKNEAMTLSEAMREAGLDVALRAGRHGIADDCRRAVAATVERHGRLDIVVNNAAILYATSVEETTEEAWDEVIRVDLTSVFLVLEGRHPASPRRRRRVDRQLRLGPCPGDRRPAGGLRGGKGRRRRSVAPDGPRPRRGPDPGQRRRHRCGRDRHEPAATASCSATTCRRAAS